MAMQFGLQEGQVCGHKERLLLLIAIERALPHQLQVASLLSVLNLQGLRLGLIGTPPRARSVPLDSLTLKNLFRGLK